jgi:hypothetical protein
MTARGLRLRELARMAAQSSLADLRAGAEQRGSAPLLHGWKSIGYQQPGFFLPTAGFLPLGSGKGSYRGYRGIPLNTARIQISNQSR